MLIVTQHSTSNLDPIAEGLQIVEMLRPFAKPHLQHAGLVESGNHEQHLILSPSV